MDNLLFELGVEELPIKSLLTLQSSLADNLNQLLAEYQIGYDKLELFVTPRRLACLVHNIAAKTQERLVVKRGPALQAAYKDGEPTPALLGFLRANDLQLSDLQELRLDKGSWVMAEKKEPGIATQDIIADIFQHAIKKLLLAKPMQWSDHPFVFARPVKWCVLLYNDTVIPAEFFGINTSNYSYGHRVHAPAKVLIKRAEDYAAALKDAYVIADFSKRKTVIFEMMQSLAQQHQAQLNLPANLLDDLASLTEWPVALLGEFPHKYLQLPTECLVTSMEVNQKFCTLLDKDNNLLNNFIIIANLESQNPKLVIQGNERVLDARFADAEFFYNKDLQVGLEQYYQNLDKVAFQQDLGSLLDKNQRIQAVAYKIAELLAVKNLDAVTCAAKLCKCDLLSSMVGEFPELQGIMGKYYALNEGHSDAIAHAIEQHYWPRFAEDKLPQTDIAICVALADRIDSIVGILGIGQAPTGEKDPYALRRAALAVVKIIIQHKLPLNLYNLIDDAYKLYKNCKMVVKQEEILQFCMDRLKAYYLDLGITPEVYASVAALQLQEPYDFDLRISALAEFSKLPIAAQLSEVNKRIRKIVAQYQGSTANFSEDLLVESQEQKLFTAFQKLATKAHKLFAQQQYSLALQELAQIYQPLADFFDNVMVMCDDKKIAGNRIALLSMIRDSFFKIAEISLL